MSTTAASRMARSLRAATMRKARRQPLTAAAGRGHHAVARDRNAVTMIIMIISSRSISIVALCRVKLIVATTGSGLVVLIGCTAAVVIMMPVVGFAVVGLLTVITVTTVITVSTVIITDVIFRADRPAMSMRTQSSSALPHLALAAAAGAAAGAAIIIVVVIIIAAIATANRIVIIIVIMIVILAIESFLETACDSTSANCELSKLCPCSVHCLR